MLCKRAKNNILNKTQSINQTPNLGPDQENKIYLLSLAQKKGGGGGGTHTHTTQQNKKREKKS